jgi:putative phosphoesterase
MRIATISDIHGNLYALQSVLTELDQEGIDQLFCLGDLVGYGPHPNEVIELIRQRHIPTIMGNYDDGVGFDKDECGCAYVDPEMRRLGDLSLEWSKAHVTAENKQYLQGLLSYIRFEVRGHRFLLVHGSPRRINEYVYEDRPASSLQRIAESAEADVLVFGHTHLPYVKNVDGTLFVNDGSVGKPKDGDTRAGYDIFDIATDVEVTIRRVAYDVAAAAAAVRASELPDHFAQLLETASG